MNTWAVIGGKLILLYLNINTVFYYSKKYLLIYITKYKKKQISIYPRLTIWGFLYLILLKIKNKIKEKLITVCTNYKKTYKVIKEKYNSKVITTAFEIYEKNVRNSNIKKLIECAVNDIENYDSYAFNVKVNILNKNYDIAFEIFKNLLKKYPRKKSIINQLGIYAFIKGEYELSEKIWTELQITIEKEILNDNLGKLNFRILSNSWFLAIGHIAHLDILIKNQILKKNNYKLLYFHNKMFDIPNKFLFNKWIESGFIEIGDNSIINGLTAEQIDLLTVEFWYQETTYNNYRMFSNAGAHIDKDWKFSERGPLLRMNKSEIKEGNEILKILGIPNKNAWYVCLHVREGGYHKNWEVIYPSGRNADIDTYISACNEIIKQGGFVIRMGDKSMKKLPNGCGIIDYAHSEYKSEFMDVFLCATAKFFLGTNSGLSLVPPLFGVPCALTNWVPIGIAQWYLHDTYIPKKFFSKKHKRLNTFKEILNNKIGWIQFEKDFIDNEVVVINNTSEEILDFIIETLYKLNNTIVYSKKENEIIDKMEILLKKFNLYSASKISPNFLFHHNELLQ